MSSKKVKTRIAPSPTGNLHLGTVRTALYNMLFAKHHDGEFLFRLEDTDKERSKEEFTEEIISGFKWLSIKWDGEMLRQSQREGAHKAYIEQLLAEKKAYKCYATKEELDEMRAQQQANKQALGYDNRGRDLTEEDIKNYEAQGRSFVVRLNICAAMGIANDENVDIKWNDMVRGEMSINTKDLGGDLVIQKATGQVLYNFAVVADDNDMEVTHVFRGEDHLSNTAKQLAIYHALNFPVPEFGHLPLIFTADKQKLSKRKHGDIAGIDKYKNEGYLAEALANYLTATSYTRPAGELFTMDEAIKDFDFKGISKSPAIYDIKKLNWYNSEYIKKLSHDELMEYFKPYLKYDLSTMNTQDREALIDGIRGNLNKFDEINDNLSYFFEDISIHSDLEKFIDKGQQALAKLVENFEKIDFTNLDTTLVSSKELINNIGTELELKGKNLFWPIRIAASGQSHGPELGLVFYFIGKEKLKHRLNAAIATKKI